MQVLKGLCQWEIDASIKNVILKKKKTEFFGTSFAKSTVLQTESSNFLEKPEKTILGPMLGPQ